MIVAMASSAARSTATPASRPRRPPDRRRDLVEHVLAPGQQHDVDPTLGDATGEGRPDAFRCAGHDRPWSVAHGEGVVTPATVDRQFVP